MFNILDFLKKPLASMTVLGIALGFTIAVLLWLIYTYANTQVPVF